MCQYVTLVADADDPDLVADVMRRNGRTAFPVVNPSLGGILQGKERQFLTTRTSCDCGTVLGRGGAASSDEAADQAAQRALRLARKGWSAARIERSLSDQARSEASPKRRRGGDSLEFWGEIVEDLVQLPGVRSAGLFVHDYRGDLETEVFSPARRTAEREASVTVQLASMRADELLVFQRA